MIGVYDNADGVGIVEVRDVINCTTIKAIQLGYQTGGAGPDSMGQIAHSVGSCDRDFGNTDPNETEQAYGFGASEGNASFTGRFLAVGRWDDSPSAPTWAQGYLRVQIVDLDSLRAGPVMVIADTVCDRREISQGDTCADLITNTDWNYCSATSASYATGMGPLRVPDSTVGHWSISPRGDKLIVKYRGLQAGGSEPHRVFDVDTLGLNFGHIKPRNYTLVGASGTGKTGNNTGLYRRGWLASGDTLLGSQGWIAGMSHEDFAPNPDSGWVDFAYGLNRNSNTSYTELVGVNLNTGIPSVHKNRYVTGAQSEEVMHVSARNWGRLGWIYVGARQRSGGASLPYWNSAYAVKADGSQRFQRFAKMHTVNPSYDFEPHMVPSWDGRLAAFQSNWITNCGTDCGQSNRAADYIVRFGCTPPRKINNLSSTYGTDQTTTTVTIRWTESGEDTLRLDPPRTIEVKYSTSGLSDATWASGTAPSRQPTLTTYGKSDTLTIPNLVADTDYYFGIREKSDCGQWSSVSNVICVTTKPSSGSQRTCGDPPRRRSGGGGGLIRKEY